ncbi:MAG: four helix bundle protein [Elusimicrobia bacterium]|nr:four helix bundle protein [Elusimicrobiota bacterium]
MFNFENLIVWRKAVDFSAAIYDLTAKFPKEEIFGVTSQLRRAAVSVASNIAEGAGRKSKKEFIHFLSISYGSLCEVITLLNICLKQNYISQDSYKELYAQSEEIARILNTLSSTRKVI